IDQLAWFGRKGDPPRLRITAKPAELDASQFAPKALHEASDAMGPGKGRTLILADVDNDQILAAVALHLPKQANHPLLVRGIATPKNVDGSSTGPRLERRLA